MLRLPGTPPRSLICFASGAQVPSGPGSMFNRRPDCRFALTWTCAGSPRFPGDPSCAFASVQDPAESTIPRLLTVPSMLPPLVRQRRLQRINHIGAIARLQHLLPTLQEWCCHHPCKARFRLAGSPLPGGSSNPLDHYKRFQITLSSPSSGFILAQRTAGFPQYGWKAGCPSGAFLDRQQLKPCSRRAPSVDQFASALRGRSDCPALCRAANSIAHCLGGLLLLHPRGRRSGSGYSVPVRHHLIDPSVPLVGTPRGFRCSFRPDNAALSDLGEFDHRFSPEHRCRHWPSPWTKGLGAPNNPASVSRGAALRLRHDQLSAPTTKPTALKSNGCMWSRFISHPITALCNHIACH